MTSVNGKFILIIDDDPATLRALTRVLAGEGGLITTASWAGDAIEHLSDKSERFDLVITDLRMPILGGETILRAVKNALPRVPVIVITAFANLDVKAECLRNGAAAFLEKPLETPELLEVVNKALVSRGTDETHETRDQKEAGDSDDSASRDQLKPCR